MKISIITVTYNSAKTISRCITSVNNQTYSDIEHIIIDGASSDDTLRIIKSLSNRVTKIISEPDNGIYHAMNKGIKLATGDIIGMLNSDDKFYSNQSLEIIARGFNDSNIDAIYGNLIFTDERGKLIRTWKSKPFKSGLFTQSWSPAHPTFYCKRELYEKFGNYKTNYRIASDIELMLRFMEVEKINTHFTDEFLINMRVGGLSTQGIKSKIGITLDLVQAFRENELPFNLLKYLFYKSLKIKEFL